MTKQKTQYSTYLNDQEKLSLEKLKKAIELIESAQIKKNINAILVTNFPIHKIYKIDNYKNKNYIIIHYPEWVKIRSHIIHKESFYNYYSWDTFFGIPIFEDDKLVLEIIEERFKIK